MSYSNFIPSVWAEGINRELERKCVFLEDCHTKYEGKVKKAGESVTILGIGKPTITRVAKSAGSIKLDAPETIEDSSVIMYINQIAYYNYKIDDIDKAQAVGGIMDALDAETSEGLANEVDKYISSFAVDKSVPKLYKTPVVIKAKESEVSGANDKYVLDVIDEGVEKLQENDVPATTALVITISPKFYRRFKKAYRTEDTDNSSILKHGKVAEYGNVIVKLTNNVHKVGDVEHVMMRTKRAIAFAKPLTHSEAYRPESGFEDAVKGFILFDAKVVRPKEVIDIPVQY